MTNSEPSRQPEIDALIGRSTEIDQVTGLLAQPEQRLITIVGPGGVGKTRLSREIASRVPDDRTVVFVPLATIATPEHAPSAIAAALGYSLADGEFIWHTLGRALTDRELLIILDNLEQIEGIASPIGQLLDASPMLKILATSRVPLHLERESIVRLTPLETLAGGSATESISASASLFILRGKGFRPKFDPEPLEVVVIERLCEQLDGLPLAIELAAAQIRTISPRSLLVTIEHRADQSLWLFNTDDERHTTLGETISRSYQLLSASEKSLFRRLSLLPAGGTPALAEAIATTPDLALSELLSLANHHLVTVVEDPDGTPRFTMLETIRAFAVDQLASDSGADAARAALIAAFTAIACEVEAKRYAATGPAAIDKLNGEFETIRGLVTQGLTQLPETKRDNALSNLVVALEPVLLTRGHVHEARGWVEELLIRLGENDPFLLRATGRIANIQGNHDRAVFCFTKILESDEASPQIRAWATYELGSVRQNQGQFAVAWDLLVQSEAAFQDLHDDHGLIRARNSLGCNAQASGDLATARDWFEKALQLARSTRSVTSEAMVLLNLGYNSTLDGEFQRAVTIHETCIDLCESTGDLGNMAMNYLNLAGALIGMGELDRADRCEEKALPLMRRLGYSWGESVIYYARAAIARRRRDLDGERELLFELLSLRRVIGVPQGIVSALFYLARSWDDAGESNRASAALEEAGSLAEAAGKGLVMPFHRALATWYQGHPDAVTSIRRSLIDLHGAREIGDLRDCLTFLWESTDSLEIDALAKKQEIGRDDLVQLNILARTTRAPGLFDLSARERDVLRLLAEGKTDRQIAEVLFIAPRTAGFHVSNILHKLGLASRTEAATWAARNHAL